MDSTQINPGRPRWIEEFSANSGGRDFLGYEYSGVLMLEKLMPGISNITYRIRYYSFFCWAIDEFLMDESIPKTQKHFNEYIKAESLVFLLANGILESENPGTGIDGIDTARNILEKNSQSDDVIVTEEDFKNYKTNYWIYRQKMTQLHLTSYNDEGVESLTLGKGKRLAEHFRASIHKTAYYQQREKGHVNFPLILSRSLLIELGEQASYLRLTEAIDEQSFLKQILLGSRQNPESPTDYHEVFVENKNTGTPQARYDSLRYYLDIMSKAPVTITEKSLREIQYFSPSSPTYSYSPSKYFKDVAESWKIFQARQYFVFATESIFRSITALTFNKGLYLSELVDSLSRAVNQDEVLSFFNINIEFSNSLGDIIDSITTQVGGSFETNVTLDSPNNEERIYEKIKQHNKEIDPTYSFGFSLVLLLSIYLRFNPSRESKHWEFAKSIDRDGYLSLDVFCKLIDTNKSVNLGVFMADFIKKYIINRHIQIGLEKLSAYSNDTFHLTFDEGKVVSTEYAGAVFNASKFKNIMNTLEDLSLIKHVNDSFTLTEEGLEAIRV